MPGLSYTGGTYVAGALAAGPAAPGSAVAVHGGGRTNVAGFQQPQATPAVHGGGRTSIGQPQSAPVVHGGGRVTLSRPGITITGGGHLMILAVETIEPVYVYAAATPAYGGGRHPAGVYRLRFCSVTRQLSSNALLEFAGGRGLPSGTARPVANPIIRVRNPAGTLTEYKGTSITTESAGVYNTLVEMLAEGEWVWEAQAWTGGGSGDGDLVGSSGEIPWVIEPALKT